MKPAIETQFPECPTELTDDQVCRFREDGYLAFEDVLSPDEVEPSKTAITELVKRFVSSRQTKIGQFFVQFEPKYHATDPNAPDLELKVRKLMSYHAEHPLFTRLALHHERIQGVVSSLIGRGSILFQDMALVKPPLIGSEKPWHQDVAYFQVTPLEAVVGVWIALDDAAAENGCMHVIPGGHKLGPLRHFHGPVEGLGRDCQIVNGRIDVSQAVPVELRAGGAMFFAGMLPHETPPNRSPHRRRALQFHYRSATSRSVSHEDYNRTYAEADGSPASCFAATQRKDL